MSLVNQHWVGFGGEPVTGRAPTQLRLMNDTPFTPAQNAGVAHAYKLFTDALNVTPAKFLVQNRVLQDGTRVRLVSNSGLDVVQVWPVGSGGEQYPVSGIGICFTDAADEPVEGWSYLDADGDAQPQPLVLRPIPKKNAAGRLVGSGKWAFQTVSRLVGGKQLWVGANPRKWLSSFASARHQHPGATQTQIINNRILPAPELLTVLAAWTATSQGRVGLGGSDDPNQLPFSDRGQYLFHRNDTVLLNIVSSTYQPFITKMRLSGDLLPRDYAHVMAVDNNGRELKLYRAPYRTNLGLAEEDKDLTPAGASVYLDSELVTTVIAETGLRLWPNTLSAHPDGKRLICMTYTNSSAPGGYSQGGHIDLSISNSGEVTYAAADLGVWDDGTYAASGACTWSVATAYKPRYVITSYYRDGAFVFAASAVRQIVDNSRDFVNWETTTVYAVSGGASTGKTSTWLNRYYYDRAGDTVIEKNTEVSSSSYTCSYTRTTITDGGDLHATHGAIGGDSVTAPPYINTDEYTATSSGNYTVTQTAQLKNRSLVLRTATIALGQSLTSVGIQGGNPFSAAMTGSYDEVQRHILFYDPVNDFIIWLEMTISGAISGAKNMFLGTRDVSSLSSGSGSAKIAAKFRGEDVAFMDHSITLGAPLATAYCEHVPFFVGGPQGTSLQSESLFDRFNFGPKVDTFSPQSEEYPLAGRAQNGDFVPMGNATITWSDERKEGSGTARTTTDFVPPLSFSYVSDKHPKSYIQANYAVDPVTLSAVVSLTFKGASMPGGLNEDKAWLVAVDATGARRLTDVIPPRTKADGSPAPIPDDAVVYEAASLNSLVSI